MTKIALTAAAAILVATGTAFADGGDHSGANQPVAAVSSVDSTYTASIQKSDAAVAQKPAIQSSEQNLFGNR